MNIPRDITLEGGSVSIILRPPDLEDAEAIYDAVKISHSELSVWMDWCTLEYSKDMAVDWIEQQPKEWAEGSNYQFAIFGTQTGAFWGSCGINHINRYYLLANLGYWVRTDQIGKGIATEASRLVAQFGFERLKLRRIEIVTGVENWASRKVAENVGATFEGILRRRLKLGDRNIDAAMHSLIPEDLII
jgi:RimJ/RimL family protein N-acetyltransferase